MGPRTRLESSRRSCWRFAGLPAYLRSVPWPMVAAIAVILDAGPAAIATPAFSSADVWLPNGTPIATTGDYEFSPTIVPDGRGGIFLVWARYSETSAGIYALGIDSSGDLRPGWPADGLLLPDVTGGTDPWMVADGAGGAFITSTSSSAVQFQRLLSVIIAVAKARAGF